MLAVPRAAQSLLFAAIGLAAIAEAARAQEVDVSALPDITGRDYSIDLFQGSALGSGHIVGMGGAAVATAEGSAGTAANPASPAVRPATSSDKWDWDWHIDWLSPELGSDFDNNGMFTTEELTLTPLFTLGVVGQYKTWALGVSANTWQRNVGDAELPSGDTAPETASFQVVRVVLARAFLNDRLTVGVGSRAGIFSLSHQVGNENLKRFEISGAALESGAVWRPTDRNLRVGVAVALPVSGSEVAIEECELVDCDTLPGSVEVPWRISAGLAYRRAATQWNRKVKGDWRDERSLLLAADIVIFGAVENGYGIEAAVQDKLQPSGRTVGLSLRAGAEYEWKPGLLRVRGGTYWEPSRFLDHNGDAIGGRAHITFGADLRIYSFCFWNDRYRARLSLTADAAEHYFNGGLSVGLWH